MKYVISFALALIILNSQSLLSSPDINPDDISDYIQYLSSDELAGRKPGTKGDSLSVAFITGKFKGYGLEPLFGDKYLQPFELVTKIEAGPNNSVSLGSRTLKLQDEFVPLSFSADAKVSAEISLIGYGLDIDEDSLKYSDYKEIDLTDKWAMIITGDPETDSSDSRFAGKYTIQSKVLNARDRGAKGVIIVVGTKVNPKDELLPLFYEKIRSDCGIPVINIKREIADELLKESGKTIEMIEQYISDNLKSVTIELPKDLSAQTQLIRHKITTFNLGAILPANTESDVADEYIVIGGHYDHLGLGGPGSGSRFPDTSAIHNGADDNASGVATVIELAEYFADASKKNSFDRNMVFMAFGAEEFGIIGSKYFIDNCPIDKSKIEAMVNLDMIGRLKEDKSLMIGGTGTSDKSEKIIDFITEDYDFKINKSKEGLGPSDHASFYTENIPVFYITTGAHADYHMPEDDFEKINTGAQARITELVGELFGSLAHRQTQLKFMEAGPKIRVSHYKFKVTLGIMPDFTSDKNDGLGVGGVRKGGPAEMAGMKKNDLIVALDGYPINNIYEYMHKLKQLKAGQIITVDVMRDGEKHVLIVQL